MAIRSAETGTEEILRDARYHIAGLRVDAKTADLAAAASTLADALKKKRDASETREEERLGALAALQRSDFELDDALRMIEVESLVEVRKDRADSRYKAVWPKGLSAMVALRGEEEAREVRAMLGTLEAKMPRIAKHYAAETDKLCAITVKAEAAWRQAETDGSSAFGEEVLARADLIRQLQKNEGALLVMFPGQRRRVRSFFRPTHRRGAAADSGGPEVPPALGPATTA